MRKIFLITVFLLLIPVFGWSATLYVDPDGDNTDGSTWAKAYNQISTALGAAGAGDIIEVGEGTYGRIDIAQNQTIQTTSNPTYAGTVTITDSAADHLIDINGGTITIQGTQTHPMVLNLESTSTSKYAFDVAGGTIIVKYATIDAGNSNTVYNHGGTMAFSYCKITNEVDPSDGRFLVLNSSSTDFAYCILRGGITSMYSTGGTNDLNNCVILDAGQRAVYETGGTTNLSNCVVIGARTSGTYYLLDENGGQITATNCLLIGEWDDPQNTNNDAYDSGEITPTSCLTYKNPLFTAPYRDGAVVVSVDDADVVAGTAVDLVMDAYGKHWTFFVNTEDMDATCITFMKTLVQEGDDVGCHQYSNTRMDEDDAFTLAYSGGDANPTWEFDANRDLLLTTDGSDECTCDTDNANYDTLGEIETYVDGASCANWSMTLNANTEAQTLATSLLEQGATAIAADAAVGFDKTDSDCSDGCSGYYDDEVVTPKAAIETEIQALGGDYAAWSCQSFAHASSAFDASSKTAVKTAGFLNNRGSTARSISSWLLNVDDDDADMVSGIDMFCSPITVSINDLGATTTAVRESARAIAGAILNEGIVISLMLHNESGWAATGDTDLLGAYIDELIKNGVNIFSHKEYVTWITTTLEGTDGDSDGIYSITWTDNSNYSLQSSSPCIDAGVDVGLTEDYVNHPVPVDGDIDGIATEDIGPYEYNPGIVGYGSSLSGASLQ